MNGKHPHHGYWHPGMGRCARTGKRNYPTRKLARTACRGVGVGSIYRCTEPGCGQYHLTSYPPNVARAIAFLLESIRDDRRQEKRKRRHAPIP